VRTSETIAGPRIVDPGSGNDTNGHIAPRVFDITATIFFWIAVAAALIFLSVKLYPLSAPEAADTSLWVDFTVFWTAAKLAYSGLPLAAFDGQAMFAAVGQQGAASQYNFFWLYPASFLVALTPLGALSFSLAFPTFIASSALAFGLAVRSPASVLPGLWRLMLASPVVMYCCLFIGQTGVLWTAGLIAGLWAMRGGNAVAAGLAIALLTMKPQLGLLIPVALIATRQWAVIGWATGFTLLITSVATALTGPEYWGQFLDALRSVVDRAADGAIRIHLMISPYGVMRALGIAHGAAIASQVALTAGFIAMIGWVWTRPGLSDDLKCATLCAAIPLTTPYAYYYEMPILLAAALFLIRDGFGRHLAGKAWLLVLWMGPAPAFLFRTQLSVGLYVSTIIVCTLAICLMRARSCRSTTCGYGPAEIQGPGHKSPVQ
jgi:hypothetical protein